MRVLSINQGDRRQKWLVDLCHRGLDRPSPRPAGGDHNAAGGDGEQLASVALVNVAQVVELVEWRQPPR